MGYLQNYRFIEFVIFSFFFFFSVLFTGDIPTPVHLRSVDRGKGIATESKLSRNDNTKTRRWYIRDIQWLQEQYDSCCSKFNRNFGTCSCINNFISMFNFYNISILGLFKFNECSVVINVGLSWQASFKFHGIWYKGWFASSILERSIQRSPSSNLRRFSTNISASLVIFNNI